MTSAEDVHRHTSALEAGLLSATDQGVVNQTLRFVAERSWRVGDTEFFQELVTHLGRSLGVAYAFCDLLDPEQPERVATLALYAHGEVTGNIEYSLAGTPCERVIGRTVCCYADNIQKRFPQDRLLVELGAESYAGIPLWGSDGRALGLVAVMDDKPLESTDLVKTVLQIVAARAAAELERMQVLERLQESQRRLADFAAVSSDWFWETDEDLRFSYFSEQFEAVTGVPPEQLLGKTREEVGAPGADPQAYSAMLACLRDRRPFHDFQHHRLRPDGTKVYLSISGKPAHDIRGRFIGFRGNGRDITDQKTVESELLVSRDQARQADRAKSEFLANMSHELRTPLNAINGFAQIMVEKLNGPLDDRYVRYAKDIRDSGEHLLGLINDILDISRVEAGKMTLEREPVDLCEAVRSCLSLLRHTAESRQVTLTNEVPEIFPRLLGDPRRIRQILLNLVGNSVKFSPGGSTVSVNAEAGADGLTLEVADQGIGMDPTELDKAFEPFRQLDGGFARSSNGAGLGLSLAKRFVELHGGTIELRSAVGRGTTAVIRFPDSCFAEANADWAPIKTSDG